MSIEFYPYQVLNTNNSTILNNVPSASVAFLLQINQNSDLSDVALSFIESRDFFVGHYFALSGSGVAAGTIRSQVGFVNENSTSISKNYDLPLGVPIHIAITYAQGSQLLYINGVANTVGSLTGRIQSSTAKFKLGDWSLTPNSGYSWKIDNLAVWNGYALNRTEVLSLRGGAPNSSIVGGYSSRYEWSLDGPIGSSVQIGNSGINDVYGVVNFATLTGSSTPTYASQLTWSPSAFIKDAYVGTAGNNLFFSFITANSGSTTPIQRYDPIAIYKNGNYIGQSKDLWLTGNHSRIMYTFPSGQSATANDTISIFTSGWILTNAGDVADVTNYPVQNLVDRSCFGTESTVKTLPVGYNVGSPTDGQNFVLKNLALKCPTFSATTTNISGYPITSSQVNCGATILSVALDDGIDSLSLPGITGLVAISWDMTNNSAPTTCFLHSPDFSTTYIRCSERLDLYNPGDTGTYPGQTIGRTRVYDVQITNTGSVYTPLTVYFSATSSTPYFANLSVQHESDFTYTSGVPVTLDRSNKWAISNIFAERVKNAGSLRFMDQLVGNPIQGNIVDYDDMVQMNDFCYNSFSRRRWNVDYDHLRAFNTGLSPYIYSPVVGSSYPATLGSNINASQTNLFIPDAATSPVIYGQKLFIDSEICNVIGVSGTNITVLRGYENTAAVSHNSGTISVGYRFPSSGIFQSNFIVYELVSPSAHLLKTGYTIPYDGGGTFPYIQYTNGLSGQIWTAGFHIQSPVLVTSASSHVIYQFVGSPPAEVSGTYDLRGFYSSARVPYNFQLSANVCFTPGAAAAIVSQVDGADLHWSIPYGATNDFMIRAARDVRDNLTPGRNVYIELGNEPWNFVHINMYCRVMSRYFGYSYIYGHHMTRTAEMTNIIRSVFNESGYNRGSEVKNTFNIQTVVGTATAALNFAAANNIRLDSLCNAPYIGPYQQDNGTISGFNFCDASQALDLYIHNLYYNIDPVTSFTLLMQDQKNAIDSYNAASGYDCKMISYEGDAEKPVSAITPNYKQLKRDMLWNPKIVVTNQDWFNLLQQVGYHRFNIFTLCGLYYQGNFMWAYYGGFLQRPGMGDGSDGLFDNTKCLAMPGQQYSKPPTQSQEASTVSTRGKSFLIWNAEVRNNLGGSIYGRRSILKHLPYQIFRNIFVGRA